MPKEVWIALITAATSLLVSILSARAAWSTQKKLAQLNDQGAERNARRDYEYEAKKRLYVECEPVLFEAMEFAENFRRRVVSLARSAKRGDLSPNGTGWLATPGYYFRSTAYYYLAPATSFKILQRRLTAIDLALAPRIKFQYDLLKLTFNSYTWDHDLSMINPAVSYFPDGARPIDSEHQLSEEPDIYRRQGLYLGIVDQIADAMLEESEPLPRCKSLGKFWAEFDDTEVTFGHLSGEIVELFTGFHPVSQPVLWRLLLTQYQLMGALLQTQHAPADEYYDLAQILPSPSGKEAEDLDWRRGADGSDANEIHEVLEAGRVQVLSELRKIARASRSDR
ncbi:hypothetical protein ACFYXF_51175 [Streptomyces sp. NPDC002680]|uniref:hypothetical protein n=1 Tax=Streptomyces sp. NPDC002680 TaxID=3364659 RepID=UPI0036CEEA42